MKLLQNQTLVVAIAFFALFTGTAIASPFTITSTLIGDPRPDNPNNLFVYVTITGDTSSNEAKWKIDINSSLHPDLKLEALFFNLDVDTSIVSFEDFTPSDWKVYEYTPAENVEGSGGAKFVFEADKTKGNSTDVTNLQDLTFTSKLSSGFWSESMFFDADYASSNDSLLGSFQLAAHLQRLVQATSEKTDSGFAVGNYTTPVPEPATTLLIGMGVAGLAGVARRKKKA